MVVTNSSAVRVVNVKPARRLANPLCEALALAAGGVHGARLGLRGKSGASVRTCQLPRKDLLLLGSARLLWEVASDWAA